MNTSKRDSPSFSELQNPLLVIDPSVAGVSGDMFVAALVDLGADKNKVLNAMLSVRKHISGCTNLRIRFLKVRSGGFTALKVSMQIKEAVLERSGEELTSALENTLTDLPLSNTAKRFAGQALRTLILAEGLLHGARRNLGSIHLHEAGSIDTLLDIVASAVALDDLQVFEEKVKIVCTPIAVGGGSFSFSHGRVSSPAPATLEIAKSFGLIIVGGPVKQELATPTGLAILANLVDESLPFYPRIKPLRVGLGAGSKVIKGVPDILRLVLGEGISIKGNKR
jgi:pyridinium-3,5-bisthiocarboxylic acid mononucleotide nickel chelatase